MVIYDKWQEKEKLSWEKAPHRQTNSGPLMLQGNTDSQRTSQPNWNSLAPVANPSIGHFQMTSSSACHWLTNVTSEHFQEWFFKTLDLIPLFCSALCILSHLEDFEKQLCHLIRARIIWAHIICKSNAQENKWPFLLPKLFTVASNFTNGEWVN